jgi:glycerate 2-kinase
MKFHRILRSDAARIWSAALRAADPEPAIQKLIQRKGRVLQVDGRRLDLGEFDNVWVLGAGKAAAPMGRALEKILGQYLSGGLLSTKYGHGMPMQKLRVIEAGHPLPDKNSIASAAQMISLVNEEIRPGDLVFCVLSGGASSLLVSPAPGITLEDKLVCTKLLLNGGADIYELNAVRKHLSGIKGGGLARLLAKTKVLSLILSDVVGDDAGTIASGPLAPDPTTYSDCIEIFQKLKLFKQVPKAVRKRLEIGLAGRIIETPKRGDPVFRGIETFIVGSGAQACAASAGTAKKLGYKTLVLTSRLDGDNEAAARFHMSVAEEIVFQRRPLRRPCCIITGGETTVRITGTGKGGRNQEFALHCVRQLANLPAPCVVASLGTDGTDGPTEAAGAIADNTSLSRSIKFGAQFLKESIENNDSYTFFKRLGDLIITGPTRTNVMDLHVVLLG